MTNSVVMESQTVSAKLLEACDEGSASQEFVRGLVSMVGDKWSILTMSTLAPGSLRFTELQRAIPGISHRMLSVTLRSLVTDGLVHRESFAEMPPRVEYSVTPLGETLLGPMLALVTWADEHGGEVEENRTRAAGRVETVTDTDRLHSNRSVSGGGPTTHRQPVTRR